MTPNRLILLSSFMMASAILALTSACVVAFFFNQQVPLPAQVASHITIMLSAVLLKLGYVVRLIGQRRTVFVV